MSVNPNEDTEFNDALRKHGILPPRVPTPPSPSPPPSPKLGDLLADASPSTLEKLSSEANDSDTERAIAAYRRKRIEELKRKEKQSRFGEILPIGRDDYTREVTEASKVNDNEVDDDDEDKQPGTGVVCFLYKDGHPPCVRLASQLRTLAARHKRTKFVSIVGDKCIPNYPDRALPTLLLYRGGEMIRQVTEWGAKQERSIEELEVLLIASNIVKPSSQPISRPSKVASSDSELEDSDEELAAALRSSTKLSRDFVSSKPAASRNVRGPARVEDNDSDFDL